MEPAREGRALLSTGLTTGWTRSGDPRGRPAVLLLHSWAASRREFGRLQPLLPRSVYAVAVDLRGHGDADRAAGGYDLPSLAADVVAVLDALDLPRAVLVGASSGGYVAQQVAVAAADRVAGLVLAGAPRDLSGPRPPFAETVDRLTDPVPPAVVRVLTAGLTDLAVVPPEFVDLMVAEGCRLPAAVWRSSLAGFVASRPPTDGGTITAPTLVVSGDADTALGAEQARALVAAVPGARWVRYAGTGHLVLWEQPERLAADVTAFLASLG
ncbi:alpha/beta hydrolase [Geodermatophilus sabuli]|uniref:Alpha/beta hydrolase n=1 Tax=Geodermatophilus sabuli TaxID=1564158 RepID=A0A7K3VVY4_9ACTN|nr:alpha/beta hydrolase [Geodermatophilus sabuli]NEK56805.1 alpha/beta hydrolase [Geodermatophilus sabuli]